eukprot:2646906-Prymnesium_polylepis.1
MPPLVPGPSGYIMIATVDQLRAAIAAVPQRHCSNASLCNITCSNASLCNITWSDPASGIDIDRALTG